MSSVGFTIIRYALVAAAIAGAYYSALFARASILFHEDTATSVPAAVQLVPENSSYVSRLAAWQPDRRIALLHRAVELNPFDAESWIQLGLTAEMQERDAASAEHYYVKAAQVDHMFLPKWTLTNFYFRQQNESAFFDWAKATLAITPYQADPVFTQMWLISQDPQRIAAAVPDRAGALLQYVAFLTNTHQYEAIPAIVRRLVKTAGPSNPVDYGRDDQIGPTEDHLLAAGDLPGALDIWRTMKEGGWINLPLPTPEKPLNNGDFHSPFFRHGFDWMPVQGTGILIDQFLDQKAARVSFSGAEPDNCVLLRQYVALDSNRPYRLQWKAEGAGIEPPSGISWHLHSVPDNSQKILEGGDLLSRASGSWDFQSPSNGNLSLLALEYARPLGSIRANGSVTLRAVSLEERVQ